MDNFSHYHCTSERHLARLTGNGASLTLAIYPFAFHLSGKSGVFFASIPRMAVYFGADQKTVRKAIRLLVNSGFFELIDAPEGKSARYRVITHKDWQDFRAGAASCIRKGFCVEKSPMPWDDEEHDSLGKRLYAISGGDFKPFANYLKGMRNTGHSDTAIASHFEDFLDKNEITNWRHGVQKAFMTYLREQEVENAQPLKAPAPPPKRIVTSTPPKLLTSTPKSVTAKSQFIEEPDLRDVEQYLDKD